MTDAEREELERLRKENERLREEVQNKKELKLRVSEKGALSIYGLNRFPVTLYKEQWERLLDISNKIRDFIKEHENELTVRNKTE